MNPKDEMVASAWLEAGRDLGLEVKSPFLLRWKGREFSFAAYIPEFGRDRGVVFVASGTDHEDLKSAMAAEAGYFVSHLDPGRFGSYNPRLFKDTLSDMGYFGPAARRPSWCETW